MICTAFDCNGKRYGDKDVPIEIISYANGTKSYLRLYDWCVPIKCIVISAQDADIFDLSNTFVDRIRLFNRRLYWSKERNVSTSILVFQDIKIDGSYLSFRFITGLAHPFEHIDSNYNHSIDDETLEKSVFYSRYYSYILCKLNIETGEFMTYVNDSWNTTCCFGISTDVCHCVSMEDIVKDIVFNGEVG